jgi:hypothetical protein
MKKAIEQIVDAYVRLNNLQGLDDLRAHRQTLAMNLQARTPAYDFSLPLLQVEEEIAIIEAGSARLAKFA